MNTNESCNLQSSSSGQGSSVLKQPSAVTESTSASDYHVLQLTFRHIDVVMAELQKLIEEAPWRSNGYFDALQHDRIEGLFFRFLICRRVLTDLTNRLQYRLSSRENKVLCANDSVSESKNTIIAFGAAFCIYLYDAKFVLAYQKDKTAVSKLNEKFYRKHIPAGTYRDIFLGVTDKAQSKSLRNGLLLYTEEVKQTKSALSLLMAQNAEYQEVFEKTKKFAEKADATIATLVRIQYKLFPSLGNHVQHTNLAELTRLSLDEENNLICTARAHLFKGVSRFKSPTAHLIKFSEDQKAQVTNQMQPGDIVLTYTAGYMSDVFIPGAFKHAITYVGSVQDRKDAGLVEANLSRIDEMPEGKNQFSRKKVLRSFETSQVGSSGQDADVIEAVAEGVIFNNLGHLMDTHVNRLLVLRPQITFEERTEALIAVFRFLGADYDFSFNFADASAMVCTEVIYRALQGKGSMDFQLVKRAGHPTLSADDIVDTYLASSDSFQFVLLAVEDSGSSNHDARILIGDAGKDEVAKLMAAEKK